LGEDVGFGVWWGVVLFVGHSQELGQDAGAGLFYFDLWREGAVGGVERDLFYGFDLGGPAVGLGFG
jgi:hypothetical protein